MIAIEIIAAVTTLLCVILLRYKNFWGWPVSIIAAICYGILFFELELRGQFTIQIVFIIQSILGWISWKKDTSANKINKARNLFVFEAMLLITVFFLFIWTRTESMWFGKEELFLSDLIRSLDYYATTLALFATFLLIYKFKSSWIIWAITDVVLITLFGLQELWWSMGLYVILLGIAIKTAIDWRKEYKEYNHLRI
tara:strand:+ start:373 stop:963 length:591 start_codon:yes stop_codon:yes gene_type:complete